MANFKDELVKFVENVTKKALTGTHEVTSEVLKEANEAHRAVLTITPTPNDATVLLELDGVEVSAEQDGTYLVKEDTYDLTISKDGYTTSKTEVVVSRAEVIAAVKAVAVELEDSQAPVITLTATEVDVEDNDAGTWDPATNIASAVDNKDGDVSGDVVFAYYKDNAEGDELEDLAAARTWLATANNVVFVTYNVVDDAGNPATEKTATFTSVNLV